MTPTDRFLAGAAAVWPLYVAFVLLLGVAYLIARAWRYLAQPSNFLAPWSDRDPGDLGGES